MLLSRVEKLQRELASLEADLKLVNPSILHFTVSFLGEIDEAKSLNIVSSLEGKVKPLDVEVSFKGTGAFPSESRISVIWVGLDSESSKLLAERAREVNLLLRSAVSLRSDSKNEEFNPHVTIARVRSGRGKQGVIDFIKHHRNEDFGKCVLGPLRLKQSELAPSGPKYSDLHVFK